MYFEDKYDDEILKILKDDSEIENMVEEWIKCNYNMSIQDSIKFLLKESYRHNIEITRLKVEIENLKR